MDGTFFSFALSASRHSVHSTPAWWAEANGMHAFDLLERYA